MLENRLVRGIHASRYVMSYIRSGGVISKRAGYSAFEEWLEALGLEEYEIEIITAIARNGKLELEISATEFLKNIKTE